MANFHAPPEVLVLRCGEDVLGIFRMCDISGVGRITSSDPALVIYLKSGSFVTIPMQVDGVDQILQNFSDKTWQH